MRPPREFNPILQIRKPTQGGVNNLPNISHTHSCWRTRNRAQISCLQDQGAFHRPTKGLRLTVSADGKWWRQCPRAEPSLPLHTMGRQAASHRDGDSREPEPRHAAQIKRRQLPVSNVAKMTNKTRSLTRNQNEASNLWDNLSRMAEAQVRLGELHHKWRVTARGGN